MRIFLFLFPDRAYFDACLEHIGGEAFKNGKFDPGRMSDIIDVRYRRRRHLVVWAGFGTPNNEHFPNLDRFTDRLVIGDCDMIIPAGITFNGLILGRQTLNPHYSLSLLPRPIMKLVIGGFHRHQCVEQLVRAAQVRRLSVAIDDDVTDQFFRITKEQGEIPLIRTRTPLVH
ncbi:MAG: hypothetical protein ABIA47_04300 [bacterium]